MAIAHARSRLATCWFSYLISHCSARTGSYAAPGMESVMVIPPPPRVPKVRKHLSADALYALLKARFATIPDHRNDATFALADVIQAALALFALKDPSLLAFEERRGEPNLQTIFGIEQIPCDTQMRTILDP